MFECPTTRNGPGCAPEGSRRVLGAERDFQGQKRRLQEEVKALGHRVLFYPKFHCELNFIERYWCLAKWFTSENCGSGFEALKATAHEALDSVGSAPSVASTDWYCVQLMLILPLFNMESRNLRDRKSTRLNSSHLPTSRMPSSA